MVEKMLDGEPVVEGRTYNHDIAFLKQRILHLGRIVEKLKNQHRADEIALKVLENRFPKEYWNVVESLKDEYAKAGRLISGPNGLSKTYSQVLENANYRCARCQIFGVKTDKSGIFQSSILTIDHIHEKTDGGSSAPENLQVLCNSCHRVKTWLSTSLRSHAPIDEETARSINKAFVESYERRIGKKALRHTLIEKLPAN